MTDADLLYERRLLEQEQQIHPDPVTQIQYIQKQLPRAGGQGKDYTVCMDFDGVLSFHRTGDSIDKIGPPLQPGIQLAKRIVASGLKLVVLTARPEQMHDTILGWLKGQGVKAYEVTNIKPPAALYIDDRAEKWPQNFTGHREAIRRIDEFGTRLLEHGIKGQKWHHHKQKDEPESKGRALKLKDKDIRTQRDSLELVKQAEKQAGLSALMYAGRDEEQKGISGGSNLDKLYSELEKKSDRLERLEDKIDDLRDKKYYASSEKKAAISEKIASMKDEMSELKDRVKWLDKETDRREDSDETAWDPSRIYRHALFDAAGFSEKDYNSFHGHIEDWADDGGGKNHPLRLAAKEIATGNVRSMNAKGLLIENAINAIYYGENKDVHLFRGIDTAKMEKIVRKAEKEGKDYVTVLFNHSDHWSTSKDTSKDLGETVFCSRNFFYGKDILLSYKTNHIFDEYESEKEVVPLVKNQKMKFALNAKADKGNRVRFYDEGEFD